MYLGRVKRGIVILAVSLALSIGLNYLLGLWGSLITFGFWIWQIFDVAKIGRELEIKAPDEFKTGGETKA